MNLTPYMLRPWLCEPARLQHLAQVAIAMPCFTAVQVARENRRWRKGLRGELMEWRDFRRAVAVGHSEVLYSPRRLTAFCVEAGGADVQNELAIDHAAIKKNEAGEFPGLAAEFGFRAEAPRAIRAVKGKVGVIPIHGPTDQRMSSELMKTGGTPLDFVSAAFDSMIANPGIGAVVLHIDSPGGGVYGVQELADKIFAARGTKPIYAMCDSMMASAAFWYGSAANMVICTPGGEIGSVGVYCVHIDESAAMEKEGMKPTIITSEAFKVERANIGPLSPEALANLREGVMETDAKFKDALRRNRGTTIENVRANYGQGRVVSASAAMKAGMCDRIMTFQELLSRLVGSAEPSRASQMAGPTPEVLRERLQLEMEEP